MLLQTSAPGVSLDLLDEWLNECYRAILNKTDWTGLRSHGVIQTLAAYQSLPAESVTLTVGSPVVDGVGTAWNAAMVNRLFYRPGDNSQYVVQSITAATQLSLGRPYEGTGYDAPGVVYAGAAYVMMTDVYALPADCAQPSQILNPVNELPLEEMTKGGMDASRGTRSTVSDPGAWAIYDDTPETSPPVLHQVQFYPPPLRSRGYGLEYFRNPNFFTGSNTSASPLPFVTDAAIVECARAKIAVHLGDMTKAAAYTVSAGAELADMLRVEHQQNRKATSFKMESRFTRHRLARVDRSYGRGWGPGQGGPN
jgi:hypothetical protein